MPAATIIGLETEYAALAKSEDPFQVAMALFDGPPGSFRAAWDEQPERPWNDARGVVPAAVGPSMDEPVIELLASPTLRAPAAVQVSDHLPAAQPVAITREKLPSHMLCNGARFYLDHTHPEWCTPECASPLEAVIYDKAGEAWLSDLAARINAERPPDEQVEIYKNNADDYGNTYGCHENYMLDAATYTALFDGQAHRIYTVLIPFLVTRQIMCGAGKVAPKGLSGEVGYQISQRADFLESIIGLQTTYRRPIVNTRDEPHADPRHYRRLHVITGDANLSEISTYLKVGTLALVLDMLTHNRLRLDLTLADPLTAVRVISQDPGCRATVELESGNRHYTAVDIQRLFLEAADRYLSETDNSEMRRAVWRAWAESVEAMALDPMLMATKLDWVIKQHVLMTYQEQQGYTWASPQVRNLDFKYHQVDTQNGLFYRLQREGWIDRLVGDESIRHAQLHPPQTTRARLRVACLERYSSQVLSVNWDTVVFATQQNDVYRWRWQDPGDNGGSALEQNLSRAKSLEQFMRLTVRERGKDDH